MAYSPSLKFINTTIQQLNYKHIIKIELHTIYSPLNNYYIEKYAFMRCAYYFCVSSYVKHIIAIN